MRLHHHPRRICVNGESAPSSAQFTICIYIVVTLSEIFHVEKREFLVKFEERVKLASNACT